MDTVIDEEEQGVIEHGFGLGVTLGLAAQAGKEVSPEGVVTFNGKSFSLGLNVPLRGKE
jgi:hypothetical protein